MARGAPHRAARRAAALDLPPFKGTAGLGVHRRSKLLARRVPAAAPGDGDASAVDRVADAARGARGRASSSGRSTAACSTAPSPSRTARSSCRSTSPSSEHPELVEPHLGTVVAGDHDVFTAANDAGWTGGAFVYVPRGVKVDAPILLTAIADAAGTALHRRDADRARGGRRGRGLGAAPLRLRRDGESLLNTVVELVVGQNATPALRLRARTSTRSRWIFGTQRAEVARDGQLDWVALGFGSANGKVRMDTLLAGEGAHAKVTGAYAPHAPPARRLRHHQEHAAANTHLRPRVPRHPLRPLVARSGAG